MPHIHTDKGQFDYTAAVFVVYKNKVLLRKHDKYDLWTGVGGHIELDENPNQAAVREVKEEVGLNIELVGDGNSPAANDQHNNLVEPFRLNTHKINEDHSHIDLIFYARSHSDQVTPERAEDKWLWLTREEVESEIIELKPTIKFYALEALSIVRSK